MASRIIYLLLLIAICNFACAQGFYNKGATVSFAPQTVVKFPDSLVNSGTLINDGDITISGAWINQGTYIAGNGTINFDNDLTQVINHNDQSISNLTVSGGGIKQFLGDITVGNALDLQDGILEAGNGARLIIGTGATITGGDDHSHVLGPVQRKGSGNLVFPMGNGTTYLPVVLSGITDASFAATIAPTEAGSSSLTGQADVDKVAGKRYWQLTVDAGALGTADVTLPTNDLDDFISNPDVLVVAESSAANGPYGSLGQSTRTTSSITSAKTLTAGYLAVATASTEHPIEVFNALSPNGDSKNDYMQINNIEFYPNNRVTIFNRWGAKVFEAIGYDNKQNSFRGTSEGKTLPAGTYFYFIDLRDGSKVVNGFMELR